MDSLIPPDESRYNAGEALLEGAARSGDTRLLRCEKRDCSAQELIARAFALQRHLAELGLREADRVLIVVRDTPAFYASFLGALRGGFIPIPVSTLLPPKDLAFIARDAAVRAVLLDTELGEPCREPNLYPPDALLLRVQGWDIEGAAPEAGADTPEGAATRTEDPAFWLYTSGTTGEPKGVVHRHVDLPVTAQRFAREVLGIAPGDRILSAPKLFFAFGLGNSLTFPLLLGAQAVLEPGRPTPASMFELLLRERPTVFFGVPTLYAAMLADPALPEALPGLRLCVSAGEALAPALFERWQARFGIEIIDTLGTTEMLHGFISHRPGQAQPGSSGRPVPGYQVRIVDGAGADVADGQVGTLLVRGASAARSYHDRAEQTARTMLADGWLKTGDSYLRDEQGFFRHMGRSDDLIKVSGQFVSPIEVEATLIGHDAVVEAAVVAQGDEYGLLKPKAYVVLTSSSRASEALARELQDYVKARISPHKYPRWIEFVDTLPKTATGKIQRYLLRKDAS